MTEGIQRQPEAASQRDYDLAIIGGGVYGATLLYEAGRAGLSAVLLERGDFGSGVSGNSLRIVHGGLRYLQNMELRRLRTSVAERRWHLRRFPDLVEPLRCMMPLYGEGLKRPSTFRAALAVNDLLSANRNKGLRADRHIGRGRMIGKTATAERFELVAAEGLRGSGIWYDAVMQSSERVLMELLRSAVASGGVALNYCGATGLDTRPNGQLGVQAEDMLSGEAVAFTAGKVINCAGPWCREVASAFDKDHPPLCRKTLAFNLLLDVPPVSSEAVAVAPRRKGADMYFLVPWKGNTLAGTYHMVWDGSPGEPTPPEDAIEAYLSDLNEAVPGWGVGKDDIRRVYAGVLPALREGEPQMAHAPVTHDHGSAGGPAGLFSICGVKWTTARHVGEQLLRRVFSGKRLSQTNDKVAPLAMPATLADVGGMLESDQPLTPVFDRVVNEEAVCHLGDLLLRRMDGLHSDAAWRAAIEAGCQAMGLAAAARDAELSRLADALAACRDKGEGVVRAVLAESQQPAETRGGVA